MADFVDVADSVDDAVVIGSVGDVVIEAVDGVCGPVVAVIGCSVDSVLASVDAIEFDVVSIIIDVEVG